MSKISFILAATDFGPLILSRMDSYTTANGFTFGVGHSLLETGGWEHENVHLFIHILKDRQKTYGNGVFVVDCGANIGTFSVILGKILNGWGKVLSIEPQERIFYCLAGNLAINNLFNVTALHAAVGEENGFIEIPQPNYLETGSFGCLELRQSDRDSFIGQKIDYTNNLLKVPLITIDSLNLPRVDLMKIDVEAMEFEVLNGAIQTIHRCKPVLFMDKLKIDSVKLVKLLEELGYVPFTPGIDCLAFHKDDPLLPHFQANFK